MSCVILPVSFVQKKQALNTVHSNTSVTVLQVTCLKPVEVQILSLAGNDPPSLVPMQATLN